MSRTTIYRTGMIVVVLALVTGVLAIKFAPSGRDAQDTDSTPVLETAGGAPPAADNPGDDAVGTTGSAGSIETTGEEKPKAPAETALPTLVDLGAGKCIPCKAMQPILEGMSEEFAGRMRVTVIDVYEERDRASVFNVRIIPTQVFLSPEGRELARHEGFISREDMLAQWLLLGYSFDSGESSPSPAGSDG
jgi:thioredoxin 1